MVTLREGASPGKVEVLFQFTLRKRAKEEVAPPLSVVELLGDFNGWEPGANPLACLSAATKGAFYLQTFGTKLELDSGASYRFCYLIDGSIKAADPDLAKIDGSDRKAASSLLDTSILAAQPEAMGGSGCDARLEEAASLYERARAKDVDEVERFRLLSRAVRGDPYELKYRLALAAAMRSCDSPGEALKEYERALSLWPDHPKVLLFLAQTCMEMGKLREAEDCLARVKGEGDIGRQLSFDRIELTIRKSEAAADRMAAVEALSKMELRDDEIGMFCDKCLKILVEENEAEAVARLSTLAEEKVGASRKDDPAYRMFRELASSYQSQDVEKLIRESKPLEKTLISPEAEAERVLVDFVGAYNLVRTRREAAASPEEAVRTLLTIQKTSILSGHKRPAMKDAYLCRLDDMASSAYREKKFELARVLWGEAERIDPYNPSVIQNLAITSTRLHDERDYRWYWDKLQETWLLYGEIQPEAEAYARQIIQKHSVFLNGIQKKLSSIGEWKQQLELAAQFADEAVSVLATRQIAFENPLHRCGLCREDYLGKKDREEKARIGAKSLEVWLSLDSGSPGPAQGDSRIVQWRKARLDSAREEVAKGGGSLLRSYDREADAFKLHRDEAVRLYLKMLFLINGLSQQTERMNGGERNLMVRLSRGFLSFPHMLLQREVAAQNIGGLGPDVDMETVALNLVGNSWYAIAQQKVANQEFDEALKELKALRELAPDFMHGLFLLAQVYVQLKKFEEALDAAQAARRRCKPEDPSMGSIDDFLSQIILGWASPKMQKEEWSEALSIFEKGAQAEVDAPILGYYRGACLARLGRGEEAEKALKRALKKCVGEKDKEIAEAIRGFLPQIPSMVISDDLNKAQELMGKEDWSDALVLLGRVTAKTTDSAIAYFLRSVCHLRLEQFDDAIKAAKLGLNCADKPEMANIKEQLIQVESSAERGRGNAKIKPAIDAMNGGQWYTAIGLLRAALRDNPGEKMLHYYLALSMFQDCMSDVKDHGPFSSMYEAKSFLSPKLYDINQEIIACARPGGAAPTQSYNRTTADMDDFIRFFHNNAKAGFAEPGMRGNLQQLMNNLLGVCKQVKGR